MQPPDPESLSWIRFLFASSVVIALMAGLAWSLRLFAARGWLKAGRESGRLQILSSIAIDARRRLVLVKCDRQEHLLLLGPNNDLVLPTGSALQEDKQTLPS